jgi:hydroxymethylpyrimidine/phosphomethylpyrimidine kinase
MVWFESQRIATENTHGTGCTLSAALAAELAKGESLEKAVRQAKVYLLGAISGADGLAIGTGKGPTHHFHQLWQ